MGQKNYGYLSPHSHSSAFLQKQICFAPFLQSGVNREDK